jgi:hypothetical protein
MAKLQTNKHSPSSISTSHATIQLLLIALGLIVRTLAIIHAENKLDFDESMVGIMALNIYEGHDFPLYFYGAPHNIGGAIEAYCAALLFSIFGPSGLAVKIALLPLWLATALLLLSFLKKTHPPKALTASMAFFSIATPFFVDFSQKARGGFIESAFLSLLIFHSAFPLAMPGKKEKTRLKILLLGGLCGFSAFVSEMTYPVVAMAFSWVLWGKWKRRYEFSSFFTLGALVGFSPRIALFLSGELPRNSALSPLIHGKTNFLTPHDILFSLNFILTPGTLGVSITAILAIWILKRQNSERTIRLGVALITYFLLYMMAYTISGYRYGAAIPPSRILYVLYPAISIFLGMAFFPVSGKFSKIHSIALLCSALIWLLPTSIYLGNWIAGGSPRARKHWYGKWSVVDGKELHASLLALKPYLVFTSYHIGSPLFFAEYLSEYAEHPPPTVPIAFDWKAASEVPANAPVAILLYPGSKQETEIVGSLKKNAVPFHMAQMENVVILYGIPAGKLKKAMPDMPLDMNVDVMPPVINPGGFN